MKNIICKNCNKVFIRENWRKQTFCSIKCWALYTKENGLQKGKNNYAWKRGWTVNAEGYKLIYKPNHPKASCNRIKEHRLIMEEYLDQELGFNDIVHHKDGNRLNNDIENLEIMTRQEHSRLHANIRWGNL